MSVLDNAVDSDNTNASQVMESLGEPPEASEPSEIDNPGTKLGTSNNTEPGTDPLYVEKRLKRQKRQHEREMRDMQAQMAQMQANLGSNQSQMPQMNDQNQMQNPGDDQIQRAVQYALNARDMQERQQKNAESAAYVQKQHQNMKQHLDDMGDKYDDFHEAVLDDDKPFTPAMRDYALTLPRNGKGSAGEVLYHLGKNPEELKRMSKLHPLDQAAEMAKLSHALISGGDMKMSSTRSPMGQVKSNPVVNSTVTTDRTPPSTIRARMKAGTWK